MVVFVVPATNVTVSKRVPPVVTDVATWKYLTVYVTVLIDPVQDVVAYAPLSVIVKFVTADAAIVTCTAMVDVILVDEPNPLKDVTIA